MNAPIFFMPLGQDRAVAELAAAILDGGASASMVAPEGAGKTAVLNRLAPKLTGGRARVIRVACPADGELSLPAFLSQIVGRAEAGALSDEDLEQASEALTQTDASCGLIALLVDDAHGLLPAALRYIQLACRSGPLLRVVLAGRPGMLDSLRGDEFAFLRHLISRNIQLPLLSETRSEPSDGAPLAQALIADEAEPSPIPVRRRHGAAWALAGLGVAASIALGLWVTRQDEPSAPVAMAVAPEHAPALDKPAALAEVLPSTALAESPQATPEPPAPVEASPPALAEAEPVPAPEPATPREAAALQPQPAPETSTTAVEVPAAPSAPERAMVDASPPPEPPAAEPAIADAAPTQEPVVADAPPVSEPPAAVAEIQAAPSAPEPAMAEVLPPAEPLPAVADTSPVPPQPEPPAAVAEIPAAPPAPEPAVADTLPVPPQPEPPAAIAEIPAAPPAPEPATAEALPPAEPLPAVAAAPAAPPVPEPAVADVLPVPPQPEPPASVVASLPIPPLPVPAPALAVVAVPEAPRRVPKPARAGPERVVAYETRIDDRRCRDIVLRAQLGEDITNADRQFLRAGCRTGR